MLKKILSGGLQGAGNALLLQSLLGEEEPMEGEEGQLLDPFSPAQAPDVGELPGTFPAFEPSPQQPPLPPQQGEGIEGLEGMDLQAILDFLMSQGQQQR